MPGKCLIALSLLLTGACGPEQRALSVERPFSVPTGPHDPRIASIEANFDQVSRGGRYFIWFGCSSCHGQEPGDWQRGVTFDRVYAAIGHRGFDRQIPAGQRWQITAYVRSLAKLDPVLRRRQGSDQSAEPAANRWSGPI